MHEVDSVRRFGGSTAPGMPWPQDQITACHVMTTQRAVFYVVLTTAMLYHCLAASGGGVLNVWVMNVPRLYSQRFALEATRTESVRLSVSVCLSQSVCLGLSNLYPLEKDIKNTRSRANNGRPPPSQRSSSLPEPTQRASTFGAGGFSPASVVVVLPVCFVFSVDLLSSVLELAGSFSRRSERRPARKAGPLSRQLFHEVCLQTATASNGQRGSHAFSLLHLGHRATPTHRSQ